MSLDPYSQIPKHPNIACVPRSFRRIWNCFARPLSIQITILSILNLNKEWPGCA
jgi:hypothetical protein